MAIAKWEVVYIVNGHRSETIVSANSSYDARKLVESQYNGSRVTILRVSRVNK